MDVFDPFFTPEDQTTTSTTPTTSTTTSPNSAQQDLLDIFGEADFFSSSSSPQQQPPTDQSTKEEPSSGKGGGGGDLDFFGLGDVAGQNSGAFQASGELNPDPFGWDPFGVEETDQESLNLSGGGSHHTSSDLTKGSGLAPKAQFDDPLDAFFGDFGQKTDFGFDQKTDPEFEQKTDPEFGQKIDPEFGQKTDPEFGQKTDPEFGQKTDPEFTTKQGGRDDFQDPFFSDLKPDPQAGEKDGTERAELQDNDDDDGTKKVAQGLKNPDPWGDPSALAGDLNADQETVEGEHMASEALGSSRHIQNPFLETEPNFQASQDVTNPFASGITADTSKQHDTPKITENPIAWMTQTASDQDTAYPAAKTSSDSDMHTTFSPSSPTTDENKTWNMSMNTSQNSSFIVLTERTTTDQLSESDTQKLAGPVPQETNPQPWMDEDKQTVSTSETETTDTHLKTEADSQFLSSQSPPSTQTARQFTTHTEIVSHGSAEASSILKQSGIDSLKSQKKSHDQGDEMVRHDDALGRSGNALLFETETPKVTKTEFAKRDAEISLSTQNWDEDDDTKPDNPIEHDAVETRKHARQAFTEDAEEEERLSGDDKEYGRGDDVTDDGSDKAWSPASELVTPSETSPQRPLLSRPGDATRDATVGGETTRTGPVKSSGDNTENTMDMKGETHGGGGGRGGTTTFNDLLNDFPTTSTSTTSRSKALAEDSGEASDDLRLDDFKGISELESESLGRTPMTSSRRHKKLRKKKHASPAIVVVGVEEEDGKEEEEEEASKREGGGGGGGGRGGDVGGSEEEEEEEEMEWKEKSGSGLEENKKPADSDTEMDFAVLEVVSSHLNLEVSKQKTSLRKRGSLARRKRPTRNTIAVTSSSTDTLFMDSTVSSPAKQHEADDIDLDELTTTASTQKKFVPTKPPMIIPGLQDLSQSKLFKQERKKTAEDFPPASSLTGLSSSDSRPWQSTGNLVLGSSALATHKPSPPPGVSSHPENATAESTTTTTTSPSERKLQYKAPVWLSEMKSKASGEERGGGGETGTGQNLTRRVDGSDALASSVASSGRSDSFRKVESSRGSEGLRNQGGGVPEVKKREQPEAEQPMWMRTALEKTSRVAGRLQGQKEGDENRAKNEDDNENQQVAPPWAAELKRKKLPLVATGQTSGNNQKEREETPPKPTAAARDRDVYTPSWAKPNSPATSSPRNPGKIQATNGSAADVRASPGTPTTQTTTDIPRWKMELAEKKRRQAEVSSPEKDSVLSDRSSAMDTSLSPSPDSSLPAWRQQLKTRRKSSIPTAGTEKRSGEGGEGGASPEWVKQAEERRARLFKSGLLNQAANESQC